VTRAKTVYGLRFTVYGKANESDRKPETGNRKPFFFLLAALVLALPGTLMAQASSDTESFARIEPLEFNSEVERARFRSLTAELRCTVCQNESLAESDAPLARDLRREIYHMIQDGRSDIEIRDFMVQRYGDFVLYRPPFAAHTLLLWVGPLILLLGSLIGVALVIRRRRQAL
jgi:cytochrome c-type biogenesis protein CcmH